MQLCIDLLHLKVGALDHAHLQGRSTGFDPGGGKTLDALHSGECFREVGLQHNPPGVGAQTLVTQHALEDIKGHVEVFEFLHVQVDERGWVGGCCF